MGRGSRPLACSLDFPLLLSLFDGTLAAVRRNCGRAWKSSGTRQTAVAGREVSQDVWVLGEGLDCGGRLWCCGFPCIGRDGDVIGWVGLTQQGRDERGRLDLLSIGIHCCCWSSQFPEKYVPFCGLTILDHVVNKCRTAQFTHVPSSHACMIDRKHGHGSRDEILSTSQDELSRLLPLSKYPFVAYLCAWCLVLRRFRSRFLTFVVLP